MTKRVVLLTGCAPRHFCLARMLDNDPDINLVLTISEVGQKLMDMAIKNATEPQLLRHVEARDTMEKDFFSFSTCSLNIDSIDIKSVAYGEASSPENIQLINALDPDIVVVYGSSLVSGALIHLYRGRIINLHLGLSPYYRGSGTLFHPFVNGELQYLGATYHHLDEGIDAGRIIHQIRPELFPADTYHQLNMRFVRKCLCTFKDLIKLPNLSTEPILSSGSTNSTDHLYRRKDFTGESVDRMLANLSQGLVERYLNQRSTLDATVPILQHPQLRQ